MSDRFEHKLREKAANFEVPFNEADWDKMNLMLEADSGKKSVSWLRKLLLLSIVANLAFLSWFGYSKLSESSQDLLAQSSNSATLPPATNQSAENQAKSISETSNLNSEASTNNSKGSTTNGSLENGGLIKQLRAEKALNASHSSNNKTKPTTRTSNTSTAVFANSNKRPTTANSLSSNNLELSENSNSFVDSKSALLNADAAKLALNRNLAELPFVLVGLKLNKNSDRKTVQDQLIGKTAIKRNNGWFVEAGIGTLKSSILATGSSWFITAGKGFHLTPGFDMYAGIQFSSQHSTRIFSQNPPTSTLLAASYDPNLPNFGIFQQVSTHNQRIGIQTFFERSRSYNPGYFKPFVGVNVNYLTTSKIEALQYSASHELEYSNVADFNRDLKGTVKSSENPISLAERFNVSLTGGFAKEWEMKKMMEKFRLSTYVTYTPTNKKSPVNIPFQWGISAGFRW